MISELKLKPDFHQSAQRLEAWWLGRIIDRPPVTLSVKPARPYQGPEKSHATAEERWLDVEFQVLSAVARLQRHDYPGDGFPMFFPNVGPELTASLLGVAMEYVDQATAWGTPIVNDPADWEQIARTPPDFGTPYWQAMERMTKLALEIRDDRYLVGLTDLHGNYDILAALRDPQRLCLDLIDCPDLVHEAGLHVADVYNQAFERNHALLKAAGLPCTSWTHIYHDGPAYIPSSDFWCLVSPQIAEELILPDIVTEMRPLERSLFHLDGPQALRHLDLLLELPQLNAIQWVYGDGNGPASRWLDVYKRIQQAGKSIQLLAETGSDALTVMEQLDPHGLWLYVFETFDTVADAEAFIRQVERVSLQ